MRGMHLGDAFGFLFCRGHFSHILLWVAFSLGILGIWYRFVSR